MKEEGSDSYLKGRKNERESQARNAKAKTPNVPDGNIMIRIVGAAGNE